MKRIDNDTIHENLLKAKPTLAYDETKDYAAWKKQVKEKYVELLGLDTIAKNACDIRVEVEEVV